MFGSTVGFGVGGSNGAISSWTNSIGMWVGENNARGILDWSQSTVLNCYKLITAYKT